MSLSKITKFTRKGINFIINKNITKFQYLSNILEIGMTKAIMPQGTSMKIIRLYYSKIRNSATLYTSWKIRVVFMLFDFGSSKESLGKQYKALSSWQPSSRACLESQDLTQHLSAKNSKVTLLFLENLETNNKFLVIEGTCNTLGNNNSL